MSARRRTDAAAPPVALALGAAGRVAYIAVIIVATLSNLGFDPVLHDAIPRLVRALEPAPRLSDAVDGARNVVLFAGLGALWIATTAERRFAPAVRHVTLLGMALSATVETLQLFSPIRTASILDVITNTTGAAAGALAAVALVRLVRWERAREPLGGVPMLLVAASYSAAVAMEEFAPAFRGPLLPNLGGSLAARIARAWHAVDWRTLAAIPRIDILLFAPAGAMIVTALAGLGVRRWVAAAGVVTLGAVGSAAIEVAHSVAYVPILPGAFVSHALALAAGAVLGATSFDAIAAVLRRPSALRAVTAAYAALVAAWSWRPYRIDLSRADMAEQLSAEHVIPLRYLINHTSLFTVTDVLTQGALFLPLGVALAVQPPGRRGIGGGLWPAVLLSLVVELGKIAIVRQSLDVTHVLIECGAAGIGWLLVRRPAGDVRVPAG